MLYLISALVAAASAAVLIVLLVWLAGLARGLVGTARASQARLADRLSLLAARISALRVKLAQRRHRGSIGGSAGVPAA